MALKPLEVLKKGLTRMKANLKDKKDLLLRKQRLVKLTPEEEHFLDEQGNTVEEEFAIENLETASDFDRGLSCLEEKYRLAVERLMQLGDDTKGAGNKRKCPEKPAPKPSKKTTTSQRPPVPEWNTGRKQNATIDIKIEILNWRNENGASQVETAKYWAPIYPDINIKQPLISEWSKRETDLRTKWESASVGVRQSKRMKQTQHPEVTEMMELWVKQALKDKVPITGEVLRQQWRTFASKACIPEEDQLKLSEGWLEKFKARLGLRIVKRYGEAASVSPADLEKDRDRMRKIILELLKQGYTLRDIYNMDETGLFYGLPPDRSLAEKQQSGLKGKKTRLTYVFCVNANGSDKRQPLVIGKFKQPRAFQRRTAWQLGFLYRNNAKAWMTSILYEEWLHKWDKELIREGRKILLLQDNFSGHIVPNDLQNIRVENFSPNLTSGIQPLDQGIIRCFKAYYRKEYIARCISRYNTGISPADVYQINQLEGMRLAEAAWDTVDATTIRNCWRKADILPDFEPSESLPVTPASVPISSLMNPTTPVDPVVQAEHDLSSALDDLQEFGILQVCNRMQISALLNPVGEAVAAKVTDQEIFDDVMEAKKNNENSDEAPADDDDPIEALPTRRETLQAALIISRYANVLNGPLARKLEEVLKSLSFEIRVEEQRNLRETLISDYFQASTYGTSSST